MWYAPIDRVFSNPYTFYKLKVKFFVLLCRDIAKILYNPLRKFVIQAGIGGQILGQPSVIRHTFDPVDRKYAKGVGWMTVARHHARLSEYIGVVVFYLNIINLFAWQSLHA